MPGFASVCEAGWVDYTWQARAAGDQDRTVNIAGKSYSNQSWHQACLRVTRAAMRQALGRARSILEEGVPATIWTTEEMRDFPVRTDPQFHTAVIDAVQVLWVASLRPDSQPRRRGVIVDDGGRVWLTGAEIARRMEKTKSHACRVLSVAAGQGLVERAQRRQGWSITGDLQADWAN